MKKMYFTLVVLDLRSAAKLSNGAVGRHLFTVLLFIV